MILIALVGATMCSIVGSTMGTVAWYAYSTRATFELSGTAVQRTEQLQIGLLWGASGAESVFTSEKNAEYETSIETLGGNQYIFMPRGLGFPSSAINLYLEHKGCATNELTPATSLAYKTGDELTKDMLYDSPTYRNGAFLAKAPAKAYIYLPFVFRVYSYTGLESEPEGSLTADQPVWITDITTAISASRYADRSFRVHVHNPLGEAGKKHFTINPKASTSGSTYVGGLLDLDKDGYYDSDILGNEYWYGPHTEGATIDKTSFAADTSYYDGNINEVAGVTPSTDEGTTFLAKHKKDTLGYPDYIGEKAGNPVDYRLKADYLNLVDAAPDNSSGFYEGGYPAAKTAGAEGFYLGHTNLLIWLEGWDHSIVDAEIGSTFSLGLQFEINRV